MSARLLSWRKPRLKILSINKNTTQSQYFDDQLEHHTPFLFLSPPLLRHTMHKDKKRRHHIGNTRVNCPPQPIHEYTSHHEDFLRSHGPLPGPQQEHSRPPPQPRSRLPKLQLHPMPRPSPWDRSAQEARVVGSGSDPLPDSTTRELAESSSLSGSSEERLLSTPEHSSSPSLPQLLLATRPVLLARR